MNKFEFTDEQIKAYLNGVWEGTINEHNLPEDLYHAIANHFKGGLYAGYGGDLSNFGGKDLALLNELRENTYMFAAAKTYQQTFDQRTLLFDENGNLRTSREFNKLGAETFEKWNKHWGATEYNTAVAQGTMASKWQEIQRTKDILPYLSYQTIGEGLGCPVCKPMDNITAPVEDKIWSKLYPPLHWNCQCVVLQGDKTDFDITNEKNKAAVSEEVEGNMQDVFKMNSGKDKYVFSPSHPYFDVQPKDRAFAARNFDLPIPTIKEEIGMQFYKSNEIEQALLNEAIWINKRLTNEEISSIQKYTKGFDKIINDNLRFGKAFQRGVNNESVNNLSKILIDAPKYTGEVYRGIHFPDMNKIDFENLKQDFKVGNIFIDKGFMSTSYNKKVAASFTNPDLSDNTRVLFQIQSKKGVIIDKLSKFEDEKEVLFNRGSKFEVISKTSKEKNNVRNLIITMKEL